MRNNMTNTITVPTLTPALIDLIMDRYDDATGGGYYGHDSVPGFWDVAVDFLGNDATLDDIIDCVVSDMVCNT